jgi:signal transduction histidine kinase
VDFRQVAAALAEVIDNALLATEENSGHVEFTARRMTPVSQRVAVTVSDDGVRDGRIYAASGVRSVFSSKPAGRRRGLGLAKALRWIGASGGTIKLESRPGRGTRAVILLPAVEARQGTGGENAKDSGPQGGDVILAR